MYANTDAGHSFLTELGKPDRDILGCYLARARLEKGHPCFA